MEYSFLSFSEFLHTILFFCITITNIKRRKKKKSRKKYVAFMPDSLLVRIATFVFALYITMIIIVSNTYVYRMFFTFVS